jgi:hypothetical protein
MPFFAGIVAPGCCKAIPASWKSDNQKHSTLLTARQSEPAGQFRRSSQLYRRLVPHAKSFGHSVSLGKSLAKIRCHVADEAMDRYFCDSVTNHCVHGLPNCAERRFVHAEKIQLCFRNRERIDRELSLPDREQARHGCAFPLQLQACHGRSKRIHDFSRERVLPLLFCVDAYFPCAWSVAVILSRTRVPCFTRIGEGVNSYFLAVTSMTWTPPVLSGDRAGLPGTTLLVEESVAAKITRNPSTDLIAFSFAKRLLMCFIRLADLGARLALR